MTCACPNPRVFADSPETCQRCGHAAPVQITASTWHLAICIAEVLLGKRPLSGGRRSRDMA